MIREILREEIPSKFNEILKNRDILLMEDDDFCELSLAFYKLLLKLEPNNTGYISRVGETYHLMTELKKSAKYYKKVLEKCPPKELTDNEKRLVMKFAPVFYLVDSEPFDLLDVIAIHHPSKHLIAYHVFWDDDYDFPDDFEPCDHEEVWVEYDPVSEEVVEVSTWFHGFVHKTKKAVEIANKDNKEIEVLVEWGKHGSVLPGWEEAIDPITNISIMEIMIKDYNSVIKGGEKKDHPLKKLWPARYNGSFEDFTKFNKKIYSKDLLSKKNMMIKSNYSSAIIQQYFLHYNFHPKYDWPDFLE